MRAAVLLLIAGGCDHLFDIDRLREPDPASEVDAALGQVIDAPSSCPSGTLVGQNGPNGKGLLRVCVPASAPPTLALSGDIDTTVATNCDQVPIVDDAGTEVCVKWAGTIAVGTLRATGSRGLVLVATSSITVGGLIDVASHRAGALGAGANWANCPSSDGPSSSVGGGGGAGGSFGTHGGDGGANAFGEFRGWRATAPADRVRGGCPGGTGGDGPTLTQGGGGGRAGGAVYLIAGTALNFGPDTVINASGMGGRGGRSAGATYEGGGGGGGGGGSGGLIGLDAPTINAHFDMKLFANGGGGGGGASISTHGGDGADPSAGTIATAAAGGVGTAYSGKGGAGGAKSTNGLPGGSSKAGGGGGGGLGHIVIFTTSGLVTAGSFSPAPTQQ